MTQRLVIPRCPSLDLNVGVEMQNSIKSSFWAVALISLITWSTPLCADSDDFQHWIKRQQLRALNLLYKNISAPGTAAGSVIASPSKADPNYFFHWVRDAGLVMDPLIRIFMSTNDPGIKQRIFDETHRYVQFSRKLQLTPNLSDGLGEPKFFPNGYAYNESWGRPQNDGPAIRAVSLIRFTRHLLKLGHEDYVQEYLYDSFEPSESLVKADLDFVAKQWRQKSFDIWEEVLGDQFYTRLVQRRALLEGADLALQLGDSISAKGYRQEAAKLSTIILKHWDVNRSRIIPTLSTQSGPDKSSGLDMSVILASIHALGADQFFSPSDDRMLATAARLVAAFQELYAINQASNGMGPALGRYPEDTYDGVHTGNRGNPWFLTTIAMAEFTYYAKRDFLKAGVVKITELNAPFFRWVWPSEDLQPGTEILKDSPLWEDLMDALLRFGDDFIRRVAFHINRQTGEMSEQFDQDTGFMRGAPNLTWSYAGFLTATWVRKVAEPR